VAPQLQDVLERCAVSLLQQLQQLGLDPPLVAQARLDIHDLACHIFTA
jgi:hypothetical protein